MNNLDKVLNQQIKGIKELTKGISVPKYTSTSKRWNNVYPLIYNYNNLLIADKKAQEKVINYGIIKHNLTIEEDIKKLSNLLKNNEYTLKKSDYSIFTIYEPKKRKIYRLQYYPHRIVQHAIMNIIEPLWKSIFIENTYACIKGRGIHALVKKLYKDLQHNPKQTIYCAKMDIHKFYPSIDHSILKQIIRKRLKDKQLLSLLDKIIDSAPGLPIGNYLSQYLSNLYLSYFDHWAKEELDIKFYYRYADDIVILSDNKQQLRNWIITFKIYLKEILHLELKSNYQIFPVEDRGIDYVGYVIRHDYILLRKRIKKRLKKQIYLYKIKKLSLKKLIPKLNSYGGWLKYCDSKYLLQNIQKDIGFNYSNWRGEKVNRTSLLHKYIIVYNIEVHSTYFRVHFVHNHKSYQIESKDMSLFWYLYKFTEYPIITKL